MQRYQFPSYAPTVVSFLIGLLLGWLVLGWLLFPVRLIDAGPRNLEGRHLDNYVASLVPFANSRNVDGFGRALCYPVEDFEAVNARAEALQTLSNEDTTQQALYTTQLSQYNTVLNAVTVEGGCESIRNAIGEPTRVNPLTGGTIPWAQCLGGLLILGLLLGLLWFLMSNRNSGATPRAIKDNRTRDDDLIEPIERDTRRRRPIREPRGSSRRVPEERVESVVRDPAPLPVPEPTTSFRRPDEEPVTEYRRAPQSDSFSTAEAGFVATYTHGNNSFERVFEIYGTDNQYLGDCSVQIADTIGNDPSNVTAFEVRLFEAKNPRSVTKLVMSEHAYNDSALRAKMATRGQPVLAERGIPIVLEGNTITIDTDITELIYRSVVSEPERSVFDRFSVKLKAFVNRPGGSGPNDTVDDLLNY